MNENINQRDAIPQIENGLNYIPEVKRKKIRLKMQEAIIIKEKLKLSIKDEEDIKVLK